VSQCPYYGCPATRPEDCGWPEHSAEIEGSLVTDDAVVFVTGEKFVARPVPQAEGRPSSLLMAGRATALAEQVRLRDGSAGHHLCTSYAQ